MTVEAIDTVETVETVETEEAEETVEAVQTVETVETAEAAKTVYTEDLKSMTHLLTYSVSDKLKARDASASNKESPKDPHHTMHCVVGILKSFSTLNHVHY